MIIAERPTNLIIRTKNDEYVHRPNDSYNKLKYGELQGERIFWSWDKDNRVEETYDDRIFNCYHKTERLQLRKANDICKAIINKNVLAYERLFKASYYTLHKAELLAGFIDNNYQLKGRVVRTKEDDFLVDDVFKVDSHANTYVLETHYIKKTKRNKSWRNLCTVIKATNMPKTLRTQNIGEVEIDKRTLDCLSKIVGLITPMLWDQVIWEQIPRWLQKIYKSEGILTDTMATKIGFKNE
jgi:hypothetical protein